MDKKHRDTNFDVPIMLFFEVELCDLIVLTSVNHLKNQYDSQQIVPKSGFAVIIAKNNKQLQRLIKAQLKDL